MRRKKKPALIQMANVKEQMKKSGRTIGRSGMKDTSSVITFSHASSSSTLSRPSWSYVWIFSGLAA